jgi:hypothetical protein
MIYDGFQLIFLYASVPAIFSMVAILAYPKWHDIAGFLWVSMAIMSPYTVFSLLGIVGILTGLLHFAVFYLYKTHKLEVGPEIEATQKAIATNLSDFCNIIGTYFKSIKKS